MVACFLRRPFCIVILCGFALALPLIAQGPMPTPPQSQANDASQHLTPAQMPPNQPTVTFQNGSLTVIAENSTLSSILNAVGKDAGIKLEGNPPEDRLFGKFGPGSPRDVITQLFSGSHIDYILQGNNDPNSVASITVNTRGTINADMLSRLPAQSQNVAQTVTPTAAQTFVAPQVPLRHHRPIETGPVQTPNADENPAATPAATNGEANENTNPENTTGYAQGQVPAPPSPQDLLDRLHQMNGQQEQQPQPPQQH
jgi:hypothetical protein